MERRTSEIIAWRGWTLGRKDGEPILRSVIVNADWLSPFYLSGKPTLEREFLGQRGLTLWLTPDGCPPIDLDRGLYAVKAREFLPSQYNQNVPVIGEVALSGRVIEHENGYRAERMMIRRLYVHPANAQILLAELGLDLSPLDLVEKLAERYHCDVDLSAWVTLEEIVQ